MHDILLFSLIFDSNKYANKQTHLFLLLVFEGKTQEAHGACRSAYGAQPLALTSR